MHLNQLIWMPEILPQPIISGGRTCIRGRDRLYRVHPNQCSVVDNLTTRIERLRRTR